MTIGWTSFWVIRAAICCGLLGMTRRWASFWVIGAAICCGLLKMTNGLPNYFLKSINLREDYSLKSPPEEPQTQAGAVQIDQGFADKGRTEAKIVVDCIEAG